MRAIPLIGTPGLIGSADVEAGSGSQGVNEITGSVSRAINTTAGLYEHHQAEQARVWAGAAASDFHVKQLQAVQQARDAAAQSVSNGGAVPDMTGSFLKSYDEEAQKVIGSAPNTISKRYLQESLSTARMRLGDQMVGEQAQLTRQWKLSTAATTADNAAKIVQQDPNSYDTQMGNVIATMPHIDPATDTAHALRARETLTNAAASSTLDRDPYALRDATGKAMGENGFKGPTGTAWVDAATPEQIKTWNSQAQAKIRFLENRAANDIDARERQAVQTFNTLQGFVAQGSVPDMDYIARVKADTVGTSVEAAAKSALNLATNGAGFGSASLPAQKARLEQMQTQQGTGTNPEDAALLKQLQTIHDTQTAAYKEDPIEASNRFAHTAGMPTQQITSVTQGLQLVAQRAPALPTVEAAAGESVSPLHPAEAAQLGQLLRSMQPDQAASALSTIGHTINDPQRIAALSKQLHDKDGILGLAMAYAGDKTNMGRQVSELLLRGDQALKDQRSETQVQKQEQWKSTAATQIRGAFSDVDVENQAIEAATRINAATALNGQDDMDAAVRMATGGITIHGAAGAKIPLPYGMKADDFEKKIAALTPASFAGQAADGVVHIGATTMPLQKFVGTLRDATLVHAGQGLYNVRAGNTLVTNAQGQRIWIKP